MRKKWWKFQVGKHNIGTGTSQIWQIKKCFDSVYLLLCTNTTRCDVSAGGETGVDFPIHANSTGDRFSYPFSYFFLHFMQNFLGIDSDGCCRTKQITRMQDHWWFQINGVVRICRCRSHIDTFGMKYAPRMIIHFTVGALDIEHVQFAQFRVHIKHWCYCTLLNIQMMIIYSYKWILYVVIVDTEIHIYQRCYVVLFGSIQKHFVQLINKTILY